MTTALNSYSQAKEFARFGSEIAVAAAQELTRGKQIFELLTQSVGETHTLMAQQLMLDVVLSSQAGEQIQVPVLKAKAKDMALKITKDEEYEAVRDTLKELSLFQKAAAKPAVSPKPPAEAKS